ncbi:MAG: hypothetical protein IJ752_06085 [Alphaproteobacteria bacterium]|nr:hypothetical protein [Alphaproteobacteria bacterium]
MIRRSRISPTEHAAQKAVVSLLRLRGAVIIGADVMDGLKFFTNADNRRFQFIQHHKEMGYTKGQPDLIFIFSGRVYFVEMKTAAGRQSPEQKEIQRQIEAQGQAYLVWRSVSDCQKFLEKTRGAE